MENTGEAIWKSFSEKGIVLAGIDGPEYQAFFQSLVRVSQTSRAGFRVLDGVENVQDGDYVLLFARPTIAEHLPSAQKRRSGAAARRRREAGKKENKDWSTPFEEAEHPAGWEKPSGLWKQAGEDWEETLQLLSQLQSLARQDRRGALISGNEVYGEMLWDAARAPGGGAGLYIPYCGKRYPGTVHADGGAFRLCTGARWAAGSDRENGTAFGGIAAGTSGNLCEDSLYGADAEIYNLPCEQSDLSEEAVSQLSDQADESGEITVLVSEQPGTTKASETPVRPAADRKIVSFQKKAEAMHRLTVQPAEVKKSGVQVKTYTEPGTAAAGDRSVLAPMPIVTDTGKALF